MNMQIAFNRRQAIGFSFGLAGSAALRLQPAWGADAAKYEPLMKLRMSYRGKDYEFHATLKDKRVYVGVRLKDGTKLAVFSTDMDWLADDKVKSAQVTFKDGTVHSFWMENGKPFTDIPGMTFAEPEYATQAGGALGRFFAGALRFGLAVALLLLAGTFGGLGGAIAAMGVIALFLYATGPRGSQPSGSFRSEPGLEEEPGVWY